MSDSKAIVRVKSSNTLSDLLKHFSNSSDDIVFLMRTQSSQNPICNYSLTFQDQLPQLLLAIRQILLTPWFAPPKLFQPPAPATNQPKPTEYFTGAIRLSKKQSAEITKALEAAITRNAKGHALDLLLVALVRATIRVDAVELVEAPFARSEDETVRAETTKATIQDQDSDASSEACQPSQRRVLLCLFLKARFQTSDLGCRQRLAPPQTRSQSHPSQLAFTQPSCLLRGIPGR
jgi:hypothetical protein